MEFRDAEVRTVDQMHPHRDGGLGMLELALAGGSTLSTRGLIAASGVTDVLPEVPGLAERWGKTAAHCPYCHGLEFADQRIGVLGFGPGGLHQAELLRLESWGAAIEPTPVEQLSGDPEGPAEVLLSSGDVRQVDALFTAGQMVANDSYLDKLGLQREPSPFGGSFIQTEPTGRTSHDRVWVAGSIHQPTANVPMSIACAKSAATMCDMALISEDFDRAESAEAIHPGG